MRQSSKHVKKVAGLLAVSAATVGICSVHTQAAPLYWDVSAANGLQAGAGTWDATGGTNWADSDSPGTAAPGAWVQGSDAHFIPNGASAITLAGEVEAQSLNLANFAAPTISGGEDDSLTIGTGGINHPGNGLLTLATDVVLGGSQTWHATHSSNGILVNGTIGESVVGSGITKTGSGLMRLTGDLTYSGPTVATAGTLRISGNVVNSDITLNGGTVVFNGTGAQTYANDITNTAGGTFAYEGDGVLTLSGTTTLNSSSANLAIRNGRAVLSGDITTSGALDVDDTGSSATPGILTIGETGSAEAWRIRIKGAIRQDGGAVSSTSQMLFGWGSYGVYELNDGTLTGVGAYLDVGTGANADGHFRQTDGVFSTNQALRMTHGAPGGRSTVAITGGTFSVSAWTEMITTVFGNTGDRAEMTISNATYNFGGDIIVGNANTADAQYTAILNVNSGAELKTGSLAGIETNDSNNVAFRQINFNGGKMTYTGTHTQGTLITASANYDVLIHEGGITFDIVEANARSTVSAALLAPAGNGIAGTTYMIDDGGAGYIGPPTVTISGAPGATAIANMVADGSNNGTYKVQSITITSPGVNASAPSFVFEDVPGATPAVPVPLATAANVSGGLVKQGLGTLDLTGANTYTGETVIEAGTIRLFGDISSSSALHIAGGAIFDPRVPTTLRGLKGEGTVIGNQPVSITELLAPGSSVGSLQVNAPLSIGQGVIYNFEVDLDSSDNPISDLVTAAGGLSFDGDWTLKVFDLGGIDPAGLEFELFHYTGADPVVNQWTLDLSATGWSGGSIVLDSENKRVVLSGLVPEPSALALVGLAALPMLCRRRR